MAKQGREIIFILALLTSSLSSLSSHADSSCGKDISEEMFRAELVVLARVKKVSSEAEMMIRISKVIKNGQDREIIKPKKKLSVRQPLGLCRRSQVRPKKKYIFVFSAGKSGWELALRPLRPSKRVKKITQSLFCASCGKAPLIKPVSESRAVKIYRWRGLPCRLQAGKEPTVRFSWFFNGQRLTDSAHYKIRRGRSGSVLNVLGLASTAGLYRCEARSLAGVDSISQSLYVHGTVASLCEAAYCLNGATCSVVRLAPGELQPVCSCREGFAGRRCELKHVTSSITIPAIIISLASLTVISLLIIIIYFCRRLQQIEKILRQQETTQKLLSQRVAARTECDSAARPVLPPHNSSHHHNYQHCGHVKAGPANGSAGSAVVSVTKSASSPGMTALAALTSSQSSVQSSGSSSLKQRRPGAPESLRLEVEEERLLPPPSLSPGVSPLYVEPWDGLKELCVHGTERHRECEGCQREADIILSQCHTYFTS